jgi:hypothetical protein
VLPFYNAIQPVDAAMKLPSSVMSSPKLLAVDTPKTTALANAMTAT